MGFDVVVQTAVFEKLNNDVPLNALVVGVFDSVPENTEYPYVTVGEDVQNEWDTVDSLGTDCTITIHTWSQGRGRKETKEIQGKIYDALHRAELSYSGYQFVLVDFLNSQSFVDADGLTRHGVQTFRVIIERV